MGAGWQIAQETLATPRAGSQCGGLGSQGFKGAVSKLDPLSVFVFCDYWRTIVQRRVQLCN